MSNSNAGSISPRRTALGNAASVLRPRASRIFDDHEQPLAGDAAVVGTEGEALAVWGSPLNSRAPSPIPSKHPSRTNSSNMLDQSRLASSKGSTLHSADLASSLSGLWGKSWSSLQGIASNVLGSDASGDLFKDKSVERKRRPFEATHSRAAAASKTQWGPQGNETLQPGVGSNEERAALVRAKKRQELLMSNGDGSLDLINRFKRRTSDDFNSSSAPPGEYEDRDALVYLHHVKKEDTLAGISIKYNCQLAAIKKANRLWSQDGVQARVHLIIPVDHCGVRGRRVNSHEAAQLQQDLLSDDNAAQATPTQLSMNVRTLSALELPSVTLSPSLQATKSQDVLATSPKFQAEDQPWTHDSWVMLEGQSSAVEIVRLPRRDLGFFPRTRRRSLSYSDYNDSRLSSLELSRTSIAVSEANSPPSAAIHSARPESSGGQSKHRRSSSAQKFANQMVGPGGVGTLGGRGPSAPGPADDSLNKVIAKHLPSIAPSPSAYIGDDVGSGSSSSHVHGATTPVLSKNIENMGVAIEGWMRKLARSAAKAVEQVPVSTAAAANAQKSKAVGLGASSADLIELSDAFEVGEDDDDAESAANDRSSRESDRGDRGRRLFMSPARLASSTSGSTARGSGGSVAASTSASSVPAESGSRQRPAVREQRPFSRSPLFGATDSKRKGE